MRRRTIDLRRFERYVDPTPVLVATTDHVRTWLGSSELSAKSQYNYLSTLAAFYKWAILEDLTDHDPTTRIRRPKLRRYLPRPIPKSDIEIALAVATPRMRAWLLLGALAGARCMEIAALRREDIWEGADEPVVVLRGKGGKERVVPLHPLVFLALTDAGLPRIGSVFRGQRGTAFLPSTVSEKINTFLHSLGINSTAHQLRHRFGTELYRLSKDLRLVQELMGHASPTTTAGYAAWDPTEAASVVGRLPLYWPGADLTPLPQVI